MIRLSQTVLDELTACESALNCWHAAHPGESYPTDLQAWRDRVAMLLDQYWPEHQPSEMREAFTPPQPSTLHLPARRRPTLSEYENRRIGFTDRYRFGIYGEV